jgi:hypothetical protein
VQRFPGLGKIGEDGIERIITQTEFDICPAAAVQARADGWQS